jgi:hypothetical protein
VSDPRPKRLHPALLAAVAVYLVSRALVLYTSFDQVAIPAYELFMNGTIARDLVGPVTSDVPLLFYYDNAMGPVLASYLVVPFYHLFGPSYLAFKLVSFVSLFPAIFLIWAFLRRHFGTRAAAVGALLFALPPTTSFKYTLVPMGNHAENVTLTMLALWGFFRIYDSKHRPAALVLAGLYAGIALMIFLGALIPVAILFACHLGLVGWRRGLRELPLAALGFALGLVPLVLANTLLPGASGLDFLLSKFVRSEPGGEGFELGTFIERFADFFTLYLPQAGTFPDFLGIPGAVAEYVFLACFVVAYAMLLPDAARGALELVRGALGAGAVEREGAVGRATLLPLVLFLPLTAIAFGLADFRMADHAWPERFAGFRYFLPHFLFAILLIAIAAQRVKLARVALPGAALFSGLFSLALIDWSGSTPNVGARYAGYNMQQNARLLLLPKNGPPALPERIRLSETFPKPFRERIYSGHGYHELFVHTLVDRGTFAEFDLRAALAPYPREHWADVARGVGMRIRHAQYEAGRVSEESWALLVRLVVEDAPHAEQVAEGLCTWWSPVLEFRQSAHVEENMRLVHASHATKRPVVARAVARGYGWDSGHYLRRGIASEEARIVASLERMPPSSIAPFYYGLGMGFADGGEVEDFPAGIVAWVPADHVKQVLDGFQARLVEMHGPEEAVRRFGKVTLPDGWEGR